MMKMKIHNYFKTYIHFLEKENYHLRRFLNISWRRMNRGVNNPEVTWTAKMVGVTVAALFMQALAALAVGFLLPFSFATSVLIGVILFLLLSPCFFLFLAFVTWLLRPLDRLVKQWIVEQAKDKLLKISNIYVIGVVGSYGKTTMKEMIATSLSGSKKVVETSGNLNTPLGVSRTILDEVSDETEVLVVEMGEYVPGDVRDLMNLVSPNCVVVTGINEAHMERMGSMENIIDTIFEACDHTRSDTRAILNGDDRLIRENYQDHCSHLGEIFFYGVKEEVESSCHIENYKFHQDGSGQEAEIICGNHSFGRLSLQLLGKYALANAMAVIKVAQDLDVDLEEVKIKLSQMKPVEHRLQPREGSQGVLVIDDTYNGNPDGVRAAIEVLQNFENRRTLYLTPGLVEVGKESEEVHREIGRLLGEAVDQVLLIETSMTPYMMEGLEEMGYEEENLHIFGTRQEAHGSLGEILQPDDVILFQNDWPENYL